MDRQRNTIGPVVAYHGCDKAVARSALLHQTELRPSTNQYDWLGDGVYFWVDSPERALQWASEQRDRHIINEPAVVGAFIHLGLCLNLTDYGMNSFVLGAYNSLNSLCIATGVQMPVNRKASAGIMLLRYLDCAVINMMHRLREEDGKEPYDTVLGMFEEGQESFPGAGFKEKTHVQIAVRNSSSIIGLFQVRGYEILP